MPTELRLWPWHSLRLVTFSAPVVGGQKFAARFDAVCPSNRVYVTGHKVPTKIGDERCIVGLATELVPPPKLIEGLDPHDPLAVRKSLISWLTTNFPETLQGIPMTKGDQPWKTFASTIDVLEHLSLPFQTRSTRRPLACAEASNKRSRQSFRSLITEPLAFLVPRRRTVLTSFYAG
jgi:hypothetical protein